MLVESSYEGVATGEGGGDGVVALVCADEQQLCLLALPRTRRAGPRTGRDAGWSSRQTNIVR